MLYVKRLPSVEPKGGVYALNGRLTRRAKLLHHKVMANAILLGENQQVKELIRQRHGLRIFLNLRLAAGGRHLDGKVSAGRPNVLLNQELRRAKVILQPLENRSCRR